MTSAPSDPKAITRADAVQAAQRGVLAGLAVLALLLAPTPQTQPSAAAPSLANLATAPHGLPTGERRDAEFGRHRPSAQARHIADWVADSRNNGGAEFIILDKRHATLYVFDADARLQGASPVLLGAASGDDSVAGIGERPVADVQPHERTTPAGRFVAERGHNTLGEDVVWVDYAAAVSMHRVRATEPKERRLQRLASPTVADNRISYGCINVPVAFYESTIRPVFAARTAIVYVLPETKSAQQVFNSYNIDAAHSASRDAAIRLSRLQ